MPNTHRLGDFQLSILSDGTYYLDGGSFFGVVPKTLWGRRVTADERNLVRVGENSLLVQTGEQNILVETGIGNKLNEKLKSIYGSQEKLLTSLAETGLRPDQIDIVINTHLHFDHCGWNTVMKDGAAVATFPNAVYYVQKGEWERAQEQSERDRISYISDNYNPLIHSGKMKLLNGTAEIVPGVRVELSPGHTRYLQSVIVESGGKTACYISDTIPTTNHLDIAWVMAYDCYPLDTMETKRKYYSRAVPEQWLTIFTHDHEVPWGYVEEERPGKMRIRQP